MNKFSFKLWRKRICTLMVFLFIFIGMVPLPGRVMALDLNQYVVDSITIFKVYDSNRNAESRRILITGSYLKDAAVGIITSTGYEPLGVRITNTEGLLQFDLSEEQVGSVLIIEGSSIAINEGDMPTLTGVNRKVILGVDDLRLQGTNLDHVENIPAINAGYEHDGAYIAMDKTLFTNSTLVTIPKPSGSLGNQYVIFQKEESVNCSFPSGTASVRVNIKYTYKDQFKFVQTLDIPDLSMYPNRGEAGDKLYFKAPHPNLDAYDVFFLDKIDGTVPYTSLNKGTNKTFQSNVEGIDVLAVDVPSLPVGEYYVVLTNPVSDGSDPMVEVVQELIVGTAPEYQKFIVVDGNTKSQILSVQPGSGPDSGSRVTVLGQFLGTLNIPEYSPDSNAVHIPAPEENTQELSISYDAGYYEGARISSAVRNIRIYIGDRATFVPTTDGSQYDVKFTADLDSITVNTPQVADAQTNPVKDVIVETETILTRAADASRIVFTERAELTGGFEYIPGKVMPIIENVIPEKIEVTAGGTSYQIPEDRLLSIHGSDFMINRYTSAEGETIIHYPIIEIGPGFVLDPNTDDVEMHIFKSDGTEVDGSDNNELGNKILLILPAGKTVDHLGLTYLKVTNPVRNSSNSGLSMITSDCIEFVQPDSNLRPIISSVTPDIVTRSGGETVVIEGSNFRQEVRLFLDGEELYGFQRQGDGKKITFTAPAGREGETQLQVMNPEGSMATWVFTYLTTYTNPKIIDFAPKAGKTGTLVIIKGENFLQPDPTAPSNVILKLIGTRVFLEGEDINTYHRNAETGKVELADYTANTGDELVRIVEADGRKYLELAAYSHAIILERDGSLPVEYYRIQKDTQGRITLFDGSGKSYTLVLDSGGSGITAVRDGLSYSVSVNTTGITIGEEPLLNLNMRTLYSVNEDNQISGCRVKVQDAGTILFTVPILGVDGYYDLTIINPDTKSDSRLNEQGFYYFKQPVTRPVIDSIIPDEGSATGGYTVKINGNEFIDNGTDKTRVFINGVEVNPADTVVGTSGQEITVKVPPFSGDLWEEKGTDRLSVPVVVLNKDGGSASLEDGFTYVIPSSQPVINQVNPCQGSAAGGEIAEILGTDFRFFEPYDDANRNQMWDQDEHYNDLNQNGRWDSESDLTDPLLNWSEPVELEHGLLPQYFTSPILPRVYFGSAEAKIAEFSRGYLKVLTPPGAAGNVEVHVVNNDSGMSNKVTYTYLSSAPRIVNIYPDLGSRLGRENIDIYGSGFMSSTLEVFDGQDLHTHYMPQVCFGNISNHNSLSSDADYGRINLGKAAVSLAGGLTVQYDAKVGLTVMLQENDKQYDISWPAFDGKPVFLDLQGMVSESGEYYAGYELVRVEVRDQRLLVQRGYSPAVMLIRSTQLMVKTPSYYESGEVTLTLYNPDGSSAQGLFTYFNPDSNPQITMINREGRPPQAAEVNGETVLILKVNYRAKSNISILGVDFRENAKIQIGSLFTVEPAEISYSLPGQLTFTMPEVPVSEVGNLYRAIVINPDGGVASSDLPPDGVQKIYIQITRGESLPQILQVTPDKGPAEGGSIVNIRGADFRSAMAGYEDPLAVYFGTAKAAADSLEYIDNTAVKVITPANISGSADIRLENPDGETAVYSSFTYIGQPVVKRVVDPDDPEETSAIKETSILGGQILKIKGTGFAAGARVVFQPVVRAAESTDQNLIYRVKTVETTGGESSVELDPLVLVSGTDGSDVQIVDSQTILVTTPPGKIDTGGLVVINPDGGVSESFTGIHYDWPQLDEPLGVVAEVVSDDYYDTDQYIKIYWTPVEGAGQYEIYLAGDKQSEEFIGSTILSSYVYDDLHPRTRYRFLVRALGSFGSSQPSAVSNTVKTGSEVGYPDYDGSLTEFTSVKRSGVNLNVNIGTEDGSDLLTLDLTQGALAGVQQVTLSIPAAVIADTRPGDITIIGADFELILNPAAFKTAQVINDRKKEQCGVKFSITPNGYLPVQTGTTLSGVYCLKAGYYQNQSSSPIDSVSSDIHLILKYDKAKAEMRGLNVIDFYRYNEGSGKWDRVGIQGSNEDTHLGLINHMGIYTLIGSRR